MRRKRDLARVPPIALTVVDGRDGAGGRPDLGRAQGLSPHVEEVAEGIDALDRRLDVDDSIGRVGVQPVEAAPGAHERTGWCLFGASIRDPDAGRDLPRRTR